MKLLFYDGFDKCSKCIYLLGIELLELIGKSIHSIGRFLTEIEKFLWSYVEVLTYIKEVRHGRKGSSTFDCTNISGILPNGKTNAYRLKRNEKTQEIKGVVVKEKRCYQLVLPDDLPQGDYTLEMYGICDDSMEKNPLKESSLDFCKPFELRDAGWYILGGGILLLLFIVIFLWIKRKKNRVEQPVETQKVEYEIQHVVTEPKAVISSAGENSSSVKMLMELVSGAQAGRQIECTIYKSAIWGRSKEMCDVSFDDPRISKQHCVFEVRECGVVLSDLNSHNGTYVNGIKIPAEHLLHVGDTLQLGNIVLRVIQLAR